MRKAADEVSATEIVGQLHALGLPPGCVLLVHTSFRAVRPVEGGPDGLIEALSRSIGPEGTLVMPSWTGEDDQPFDPAVTPASRDLGVVADSFWRQPGTRRSPHPFAFAARGPKAEPILSDPFVLPPHQHASPVGKVWDHDGHILLLGVDHDANTTLHLTELLAGVPYRTRHHITVLRDGNPERIEYLENDHCCALFRLADGWMNERGLQSMGPIGHAPSKLMRSRDLVATTLDHLNHDPLAFLHAADAGCVECAEARASLEA